MKREYMIDLETLFIPEELPVGMLGEVTEIGCVEFSNNGIEREMKLLFPREGNGICTAGAVTWWNKQVGNGNWPLWMDARCQAECPEELASMKTCLEQLTRFIGSYNAVVWTKGSFDIEILAAHYAANQMPCPWKYYNVRDLRTVMKECGVVKPYEETTHNALRDCHDQVELLLECRERISHKGTKDTEASRPESEVLVESGDAVADLVQAGKDMGVVS